MLYANVVFGLSIEGPFDYSVNCREFCEEIKPGARVEVYLRNRKMIGYVVGVSKKTNIKNTRPILKLLDSIPVLDKNMLLLTREISDYYCCSWGEAIELALPEDLRKGKSVSFAKPIFHSCAQDEPVVESPVGVRFIEPERDILTGAINRAPTTEGEMPEEVPEPNWARPKQQKFAISQQPQEELSRLEISPKGMADDITLLHDMDGKARWDVYLKEIKEAVTAKKSVIILLPDKNCVLGAKQIIESSVSFLSSCPDPVLAGEGSCVSILSRKEPHGLEEWLKIKTAGVSIVIGSRSTIFAPVNNLGLIIIDEEGDSVYKQDQAPHYNARQAAVMRSRLEKARLILGSAAPSLESLYLVKKNKIKYNVIPRKTDFPEINFVDLKSEYYLKIKRGTIISKYLADSIILSLNFGGKILLFLNRQGFATFAFCHNCGTVLKCPRCSINLVYHFQMNQLTCHYCNFKMDLAKICPDCNAGYIKFAGSGVEKIESELFRLFPQARIKRIEKQEHLDLAAADIFVATSSIIKHASYPEIIACSPEGAASLTAKPGDSLVRRDFDLIGVLSIDNSLNRIDLRSSEKTFALLAGLLKLTDKKIIIQTSLSGCHCFQALSKKNFDIFYEEELKQRKQLDFPPYRHMVMIKLRGMKEEKVKEASSRLFSELKENNKDKSIHLLSVNPASPLKLRSKFYWQILISSGNVKKVNKFLKLYLKKFSASGIIITVDVDPV